MKPFISSIGISACVWLPCAQLCWGQTSAPAPTPRNQPKIAAHGAAGVESERAEDAALLQQMDSDNDLARPENGAKGSYGGGGVGRNWAAGPTPMMPGTAQARVKELVTRPGGAGLRSLVVRSSPPDPQAQTGLEEDLAVMSHLLDKALEDLPGGPGVGNKVLGIDVFFTSGSSPLRSLYLDDYGAIFFLSVNFPVIAPLEKHSEEKAAGDSAWEEARQELYGQRFQGGGVGQPVEEYSQEKVDKLKETLFEAIKNASNIRGLKPEDYVTLWVCGGTGSRTGRVRAIKTSPGTLGGNIFAAEAPTSGKRTVLTIRARKSEIDEYAKGKLNAEQFQKRAQLTTYMGDGAAGGLESPVRYVTHAAGF